MAKGDENADRVAVLGEYRGKPITAVTIAVQNVGDGLSKALEIDPVIIEVGDSIRMLIDGVVKRHDYELIEKADSYEIKLVIKGGTAMLLDDAGSAKKLRVQADRIAKAVKEKAGESRLGGDTFDAGNLEPGGDDD